MTTRTVVEFTDQTTPVIIQSVQNDTGRVLEFILKDFQVPSDSTAILYTEKPNGKKSFINCIVLGSDITANITSEVLDTVGEVACQLEIRNNNEILTTYAFCIVVNQRLKNSDLIESTNEFTALDNALKEVKDLTTPLFEEAIKRENIQNGEAFGVLFGKIKKYFTDLKNVAFSGSYNDLSNKPSLFSGNYSDLTGAPAMGASATREVANDLQTTVAGYVLDARQGDVINKMIDEQIYKGVGAHSFWTGGGETLEVIFKRKDSFSRINFLIIGNYANVAYLNMYYLDGLYKDAKTPVETKIAGSIPLTVSVNANNGDMTQIRIRITIPADKAVLCQVVIPNATRTYPA